MQNNGEIKIVTFEQLIDEWKTLYDSVAHVYNAPNTTKVKTRKKNPAKFKLEQNYPNPFNPRTKIRFSIPAGDTKCHVPVQLRVFDLIGKEVTTLADEELLSGEYEIIFDARDLPSCLYVLNLQAGNFIQQRKMVLTR